MNIDEDWIARVRGESEPTFKEFLSNDEYLPTKSTMSSENTQGCSSSKRNTEIDNQDYIQDSDEEENPQENVGNIDTLVDDADVENRCNALTFAPGEGQRPLSIYQDSDSEYMCFPTIFCGQRRQQNCDRLVPVSYSDICKWELRGIDPRAANSVPNIFFKLKKIK